MAQVAKFSLYADRFKDQLRMSDVRMKANKTVMPLNEFECNTNLSRQTKLAPILHQHKPMKKKLHATLRPLLAKVGKSYDDQLQMYGTQYYARPPAEASLMGKLVRNSTESSPKIGLFAKQKKRSIIEAVEQPPLTERVNKKMSNAISRADAPALQKQAREQLNTNIL